MNVRATLGDLDVDGELRNATMWIWNYELQILLCSDYKISCFYFVTSSPTAQSTKFFVFNY